MSIYTLHQNPADQTGDDLICLAGRFNWLAALLPPVWAAVNGLWRIFGIMVAVLIVFIVLSNFFVFPLFGFYVLAVWWLGFEANHLHSKAMVRKGWGEGVDIIAPDALMAEREFLSRSFTAVVEPAPQ